MIFFNYQSPLKAIFTTLVLCFINLASAGKICNSNLDSKNLVNRTSDFQNNARILGGQPAKIEEFPYVGSVVVTFGELYVFCTGLLISDKFVVTLSGCFYDPDTNTEAQPSDISVTLGTNTISLKADVQPYNVKQIYAHPDYSSSTTSKGVTSIGLIELSEPVPKEVATPAKIYSGKVADNMELTTAGWGSTSFGATSKLSESLNKISVYSSSSKNCELQGGLWTGNDGNLICTVVKNNQSVYYSDVGGPLVYTNNGVSLLVGVTFGLSTPSGSTGIIPGLNGSPNYFSHLFSYVDWIVKVTGIERSALVDTKQSAPPGNSTDTENSNSATVNTKQTTSSNASTNSQNNNSATKNSSSPRLPIFISKYATPMVFAVILLIPVYLY